MLLSLFFPVLLFSHHYPSMVGALLFQSPLVVAYLQSSLLLRRRLSLVADIVSTGCGVSCVKYLL